MNKSILIHIPLFFAFQTRSKSLANQLSNVKGFNKPKNTLQMQGVFW